MSVPEAERITPPPDYPAWKAVEKLDWLWNDLVLATAHTPVTRPDLTLASPVTMLRVAGTRTSLERTLDHTGDLMPVDRPKIIHAQGAVAVVRLVPDDDSPFTGVLAPPPVGGATGLLRMSVAVPPKGKAAFTPGFGLKLPVDGAPSLDILAMNHTVGQGRDVNLFANTFTHDLRDEHKELRPPQRLLQFFFTKVSREPRRLTIDHFARTTRDGSTVAAPVVPRRLVFRPDRAVRRRFRTRDLEDFRESLARLEPGATLYEVEAVETPERTRRIGTLVLETGFVSSTGGDRLFFRHTIAPDDRIRS